MSAFVLALAMLVAPTKGFSEAAMPPAVLAPSLDVAALEKLNAEWLSAYKSHDGAVLERILTDDFEAIYPGGRILTKADLVKAATNPTRKIETIVWEDLKILVFGDVAVVRGRGRMSGATAEGPFSSGNDYADVYIRRTGGWRAISAHVVKVE